jgi:hypothetical protein
MTETSLLWSPKLALSGYITGESADALHAGAATYDKVLQGVSDIPANQIAQDNIWNHAWLIDANSETNPYVGKKDFWGPNPAFPTPRPSYGVTGNIYLQNPLTATPFINWGWNAPNALDFSLNGIASPPVPVTDVHNGLFLSAPLWSSVDPLVTQVYVRGEVQLFGYSLATPAAGFRICFGVEIQDATGYTWFMEMQPLCDRFTFEGAKLPYTRSIDYGSGTSLFWAPNEMVPIPRADRPVEYQFDVTDLLLRATWPGRKPVSPVRLAGCYIGGEMTGAVWAWWRMAKWDVVTGEY